MGLLCKWTLKTFNPKFCAFLGSHSEVIRSKRNSEYQTIGFCSIVDQMLKHFYWDTLDMEVI